MKINATIYNTAIAKIAHNYEAQRVYLEPLAHLPKHISSTGFQ